MSETKTIFQRKTTIKTIVRARATKHDLQGPTNRFLVPENGGHSVAKFVGVNVENKHEFQLHSGDNVLFETLENIWLL